MYPEEDVLVAFLHVFVIPLVGVNFQVFCPSTGLLMIELSSRRQQTHLQRFYAGHVLNQCVWRPGLEFQLQQQPELLYQKEENLASREAEIK